MNIIISNDYDEMSTIAANTIVDLINSKPDCILGLATGSTPVGMYKKLIEYNKEKMVDFSNVTTFNLDEYLGLNGTHPQSYRYFMDNTLFNHINIDKNKTHVPNGLCTNFDEEAYKYDEKILKSGGIDLQILGIGNNGHIGFNEPSNQLTMGTHIANLSKNTIEVNSRFFNSIDEVPTQAITMGLGSIMKAKHIILLANGDAKSNIIKEIVNSKIDPQIPASLLQVHPNVSIIVDKSAGKLILNNQSNNFLNFKVL